MEYSGKVSVIVPNYNGERFLKESLLSVLKQTYSDLEVLVVDDGSTDGSLEMIEGFCKKDSRVKLIKMEGNQGAAKSRNAAIRSSVGRFIAFLDADDVWSERKLECQIELMLKMDVAISCTAVHVIDASGNTVGQRQVPSIIDYSTLLRTTPMVTSSIIFDTVKTGRIEMPDIRRRQDLAMWLKIIRLTGPALGVSQVLGAYRVHEYSLSRNKWVSALYTWKVIREVEGLSFLKSTYYFSFYAVGGVLGRLRGMN